MKKVFIALIIALALLVAGIYMYIPGTLTVSAYTIFRGTTTGINRALLQKKNWQRFWVGQERLTPGNDFQNSDALYYNGDTFRITTLFSNSMAIKVTNKTMDVHSMLLIAPLNRNSVVLNWSYTTATSANPFARVQQYQQAVQTKQNMTAALQSMKQYLGNDKNVYGISIEQSSTHDTLLVSTHAVVSHYPATADIYALVKKLQVYIHQHGAEQTGHPMLNISPLDTPQYKIMVAIPTNKALNGTGDIVYKRMIPGGFLTTTVTGGSGTVDSAYQQMQHFLQDYQRVAMAIPFQVLVTDRSLESDTAKWITRLYFPVM